MEDYMIVQLYWDRNESAIEATSDKYGRYLSSIAGNILDNQEDAEECVNDTYLKAWDSMPPHKPAMLNTYLGKLTRNIAFNLYKRIHAKKRGDGRTEVVLDELAELISGDGSPEKELDRKELVEMINSFLAELPKEKRMMFVSRYWYADSVSDIAKRFNVSENNVSVTLNRLRKKLHNYLLERGFEL